MKQEDKDLLLRYLSMALPYGVKVRDNLGRTDKLTLGHDYLASLYYEGSSTWMNYKPYLRPMSSMTEEEDKQRIQLGIWRSSQTNGHEVTGIKPDISQSYNSQAFQRAFNFLLKNHFDIFGLIPRDLAVEVTKENNPYNIAEK